MENPTAGASNESRSNRRVSHEQAAIGQTRGIAGALSPTPANRSNDFDELDCGPGQVDGRVAAAELAVLVEHRRRDVHAVLAAGELEVAGRAGVAEPRPRPNEMTRATSLMIAPTRSSIALKCVSSRTARVDRRAFRQPRNQTSAETSLEKLLADLPHEPENKHRRHGGTGRL
jgi:hypothetical protein